MSTAFSAYTRSTAFSLSMSARMIDRILGIWKVGDLASRYTWWTPPRLMGTHTDPWGVSGTDQALARRGLLEVPTDPDDPFDVHMTRAGELLALLMIEAEFNPPARPAGWTFQSPIPPHPDDCDEFGHRPFARTTVPMPSVVDVPDIEPIEWPRDRRLDLWQPGDEAYWCDYHPRDLDELIGDRR